MKFKLFLLVASFLCVTNVFCSTTYSVGGNTPVALIFHPNGKFVYSVNSMSNDITEFSLDSKKWIAHSNR